MNHLISISRSSLVAAALIGFAVVAACAQDRASVIDDLASDCIDKHVTGASSVPMDRIKTYCACYAKCFSQLLSLREVAAMNDQQPHLPAVQIKARQASELCVARH